MGKIVRLFVLSLIAILISLPLIAGGHEYVPYPVIFIHGFNSDMNAWTTTKSNLESLYLHKYGYEPNLQNPNDPPYFPLMNYGAVKRGDAFSGHGDCTVIANYYKYVDGGANDLNGLKQVINKTIEGMKSINPNLPLDEQKVIIVAHSFGGIVTRRLLKEDPNIKDKIARVIFIDTPHAGSPLASALYMLSEKGDEIFNLYNGYSTHSIDIGFAHTNLQKEVYYQYITNFLNDFMKAKGKALIMAEYLAKVDTSCDKSYDTSLKQLRLNEDVTLKLFISDLYGVHRTLYEYTTPGSSTFLGNASTNLGIPNNYDVIYSDLDKDWTNFTGGLFNGGPLDLACGLGGVIYNSMLRDYFIFPPGETLLDLVQNGDAIVTKDSATAIGGKLHLISDRSHVAETSYWEKIKEVLCEDAPILNVQEPLPGKVYITKVYTKGKLRDYLPLSNCIDVNITDATDGDAWTQKIANFINYKPISLNPDYEEINDNYQALFKAVIDLFPNKSSKYDDVFELKYIPYNPANVKGAEQGINFTYACLVSTATTPSDNEQNVPLDKEVKIVFKEKIRRETFTPQNISFTGGNVSVLYDTSWLDEKTVQLSPYGPLSPLFFSDSVLN